MHVDIAIVGAGPAGLCFARSLAGSGLSLALIEPQPRAALAEAAFDGREIALTHASRTLLEQLDLWSRIDPDAISPLRDARVMNGSSPFALTFAASQRDRGDLGWLVPNHLIRRAAFDAVQAQPGLTLLDGVSVQALHCDDTQSTLRLSDGRTLRARLVVAADSRFSSTRRMRGIGAQMRDFGRSMLVCRVSHERPHQHTAWEWFGYGQTLALLPLRGNQASAVLTLAPERAQALMQMDEAALGAEISARFEHRLGAMTPLVRPQVYPLVAVYAQRFVGKRYALIGDAAVGMHPVTAHGFNFGLQSQARLARALHAAVAQGGDIAAPALLAGYERGHRLATRPLYEATNAIAALYTDDRLPARALRNAALRVADRVAPFKRAIAAHLTQRGAVGAR
ncbi:5-demethoxyubiquinol-8 5-hydroxylase UbiM [Xanthomonas sp. NCPPB 2654]|uniref:5-demethoxyubiquinol-8 5-hydroxylase UbiM n=1 Tax=unclassified Xanthomonas TaxID=2643310 RepID=UPI0021E01BDB|nr:MULTISPECIES: 5-demethoxyubiquinol-8 5-hydroxylase UbiM [unclassified Xanthomonas]MDL5368035.1 5-demethoxyubiquinol-8 5-hydroxylase UbiM [Xanthomonas sp. NCPPB 2654]UYC19326.1 5-demethoxyubiquinol-8 5-hydroxylase UbiM [Xanthomonas sp. CFBP 8443]